MIVQEPGVEDLKTVICFRNILIEHVPPAIGDLMTADELLDGMNANLGGSSVKVHLHEKEDTEQQVDYYLDLMELV